MIERDKLIFERDAAEYIGMSIAWLQRGRCYGFGPAYVKVGGPNGRAIRYRQSDLDRWLEENTHQPEPVGV